jgi:hypothetical protein
MRSMTMPGACLVDFDVCVQRVGLPEIRVVKKSRRLFHRVIGKVLT